MLALRKIETPSSYANDVGKLVAKIPAGSEIDRIHVLKTYALFITLQEVPESLGTNHLSSSLHREAWPLKSIRGSYSELR
jgi:hypothetical protein